MYTTIESDYDCYRLQQNINRLVEWADTWQLSISIKKCQALQIGSRQRVAELALYNIEFSISENKLPNCDTVSDLGVNIDSELKFSSHVNVIVHKALTRSYLLHKCFLSRDRSALVKAFVVYVRPILEYCSSIYAILVIVCRPN